MLKQLKARLNQELNNFIRKADKRYSFSKISPLLSKSIKDFVFRVGKRLRPILFAIGYLGFAKRKPAGLYTSAISTELLHDFLLIHDDIIDKSDTRRGKPAMHKMLGSYLTKHKKIKFSGQDLAIVAADILYALAIEAFLSIKEDPLRKEKALKKFIAAAVYTGSGEFLELLSGGRDLEKIKKEDIYKIYDYKTAYYTFASPLAIGAILAGAGEKEVEKLIRYGIYLGRAFQIKDDILGIFGDEKKIGKSILTDLQEAKKTLLIWHAFRRSGKKDKLTIRRILAQKKVNQQSLLKVREIIIGTGALRYAKKEVLRFAKGAQATIASSKMQKKYKTFLKSYSAEILNL